MSKPLLSLILSLSISMLLTTSINAATYYISPDSNIDGSAASIVGKDTYDGKYPNVNASLNQGPFKTFTKALQVIKAGDTLILLNGIYSTCTNGYVIYPTGANGTETARITIKAETDGNVIVDAKNLCVPFKIGQSGAGAERYYTVEGIVFANSNDQVVANYGSYNEFKRISAYNANTDTNSNIFLIWGNNNLYEDVVAAGSGRKMFMLFSAVDPQTRNNVIRRSFSLPTEWKGRLFCTQAWPNSSSYNVYGADFNTLENVIAYANSARGGFVVGAQATQSSTDNKVFGSMTINAGNTTSGLLADYGTRLECNYTLDANRDGVRVGFEFANDGNGGYKNHIFKDIFISKSAASGIDYFAQNNQGPVENVILDRITSIDNFTNTTRPVNNNNLEKQRANTFLNLPGVLVTNSNIEFSNFNNGMGAKIQNRYIDGNLTGTSLWPWPMEDRIKKEFPKFLAQFSNANPEIKNFSVSFEVCEKHLKPNGIATNCGLTGPVPTTIVLTPSPTSLPTPNPSINPIFDVNNDGKVNLLDVIAVLSEIFK